LHKTQSKPRIKFATVVSVATSQARDRTFDPAHARKITLAVWASINETRRITFCPERKIMTALLTADPKIAASMLPLNAVRQNPPSPSAKLRENMCQLVSKRATDLDWMMNKQRI